MIIFFFKIEVQSKKSKSNEIVGSFDNFCGILSPFESKEYFNLKTLESDASKLIEEPVAKQSNKAKTTASHQSKKAKTSASPKNATKEKTKIKKG
jgi:hypothetical protein